MNFLSIDEQFKESINNAEIERIQDYELRNIRYKYWDKRRKAFLDEKKISDRELEEVWDRLYQEEKVEIEAYLMKHGIDYKLNWET